MIPDPAARTFANISSFPAQLCSSLGSFESTVKRCPDHDCVTMLQARFVLLIENFMIRLSSIEIVVLC